MKSNYKLVILESKYCDYLRQFDHRVAYNANEKELRPFVGVLFYVNSIEYFAPLSSPKPKHKRMKNTLDFYKINNGVYGAVNLNNMIPVPKTEYRIIDTNKVSLTIKEAQYTKLLKNQLFTINRDQHSLSDRALKLYQGRINKTLPSNMMKRCCDFKLLEKKCREYQRTPDTGCNTDGGA